MAALPSLTQVAGNHSAIYDAYYQQVDPSGTGTIAAMDAARFLKKSGLSDVVLSRIWDLSDPGGRGMLDQLGFYVALKLVACAQAGRDISTANLVLDLPPPKMGGTLPVIKPPKPAPPSGTPLITSLPSAAAPGDWSVKPAEREKYDRLFESLQPLNGRIPGNKVKGVLMDSKLPLDILGKIWDLADMDKDGMLDRHEFIVAMHLVYKALGKHAIPNVLPPELLPPSRQVSKISSTPPPVVPMTSTTPLSSSPVPPRVPDGITRPPPPLQQPKQTPEVPAIPQVSNTWVVTAEERIRYDAMFLKADLDRDGFVSGQEIKDVFLQSGVPQHILAHIWSLCDIKQTGKLNGEQFALAMWLVQRCLQGKEPPLQLSPEMVPPSFRPGNEASSSAENNNATPAYSNPELDMISKDIEELVKEKLALETDIAQKEADIKIKSGEIKSLQSELDTLAATLKQLENQKGEAQKRLNDLKLQRSAVDKQLEDIQFELDEQLEKVDKLRMQSCEQAEMIRTQEEELSGKKEQLEALRREEETLERQRRDGDARLDRLTQNLQEAQIQISQAKAKITQLQEQQRQMRDAIVACDAAIESNDASAVADTSLKIEPEFRDPEFTRVGLVNGTSHQNGFNDSKDDPFTSRNGISDNKFDNDPFASDPFQNSSNAFGSRDPFAAAFPPARSDGFTSDPFASFEQSNTFSSTGKKDPFDPFGDGKGQHSAEKSPSEATSGDKDAFGCDPFAILHAPTRESTTPSPRPSSPSPALPPKKAKQPPPRPAPPRPSQPPLRPPQPSASSSDGADPFSRVGSTPTASAADPFGGSGFADFSDFDAKFSAVVSSSTAASATSNSAFRNSNAANNNRTINTSSSSNANKTMDFADDPFKDYRYEDPFNIADPFEDDADVNANSDKRRSQVASASTSNNNKVDPFGFPAYAVPSLTPPATSPANGRLSVPPTRSDGVGSDLSADGRRSAPPMTEDQQLAWAAEESLREEEVRKKRQLQEQADFEYAIALSKAESRS